LLGATHIHDVYHDVYTAAAATFTGRCTVPVLWDKQTNTIINNGVYRCGFAQPQQAYDRAFDDLFATLDNLNDPLANNRYLLGDKITEPDWRIGKINLILATWPK